MINLPETWRSALGDPMGLPYFRSLEGFLEVERQAHSVFPAEPDVFQAFECTPLDQVRVVILGQDPYHDVGQAHGLAFSVRPGVKLPASLRNIFKELHADLGVPTPGNGCLIPWARQGVLLLNTVLTVRAHQAHSHRGRGWEVFTDQVIKHLGQQSEPLVFVLWGKPAQAKKKLIEASRHLILEAPHPSPLSAHGGFFGSRPFSKINDALRGWGKAEIDWTLAGS